MTGWRIPALLCTFENDTFFFPLPIVGNHGACAEFAGIVNRLLQTSFGIAPAQTIGPGRKLLDLNIMITDYLGGPCLFTAEKYINLS